MGKGTATHGVKAEAEAEAQGWQAAFGQPRSRGNAVANANMHGNFHESIQKGSADVLCVLTFNTFLAQV